MDEIRLTPSSGSYWAVLAASEITGDLGGMTVNESDDPEQGWEGMAEITVGGDMGGGDAGLTCARRTEYSLTQYVTPRVAPGAT